MPKRQVFYSFHYDNDVRRVQQIRNMGVLEGNTPVSPNDWEKLKLSGDSAVKNWIDENMKNRSCVIVLIGSDTASRRWVKYEIEHAWDSGKALLGIYIHNIKDPVTGKCHSGQNPFEQFYLNGENFKNIVPCYNPDSNNAYGDIASNIDTWIEKAIMIRSKYK